MDRPRGVPLLVLVLGGVLLAGVGGVAALSGSDDDDAPVASASPTASAAKPATPAAPRATPRPTRPAPTTPPPGSLAAYALAADRVCNAAFAAARPVDLDRQALAQVLDDRATSAQLEVRTASQLLALPRPRDARAARVPAVLTAHRAANAAVLTASRPDGRALQARAKALVDVEDRPRATSAASGKVFLGLGSKRCAAWLNPELLQDTGAT